MYQYKSLDKISLSEISQCMNLAFSDYAVPIHLTEAELSNLFWVSGVDRDLSYGAFFHGTLVGFMLNSCGLYQGHRAAFNVATGVIPLHRDNQVFTNLLFSVQHVLRENQIERYYLEVLQQNERAISLYERQVFSITRELFVLSSSVSSGILPSNRVKYACFSAFDFSQVFDTNRNIPSYEHSDHVLKLHPHLYNVAYVKKRRVSAWCVFSNTTGQLFQLGWSSIHDLSEIVQSMLTRYPHVIAKNIEASQQEILKMLNGLQFKVVAKQYEMIQYLR